MIFKVYYQENIIKSLSGRKQKRFLLKENPKETSAQKLQIVAYNIEFVQELKEHI